jgi:hypothetical protein
MPKPLSKKAKKLLKRLEQRQENIDAAFRNKRLAERQLANRPWGVL